MDIREVWGIPKARIGAFLHSQADVLPCGEDRFSFLGCSICLTELPDRAAGPLSFPNTRVEFHGPESETAEIYRRFVLHFISAGG